MSQISFLVMNWAATWARLQPVVLSLSSLFSKQYLICFSSLDVEGAEFQILKTIPFNDVDIKVINIEVQRIGAIFPDTYEQIEKYLERMGYELHSKISNFDAIFVKKGFSDEINEL